MKQFAVLLGVILLTEPVGSRAQGQPAQGVGPTLIRDWTVAQARHSQVRYTITGQVEFKKAVGGRGAVQNDANRPFRATVTIDIARRMSRIDIRHDIPSEDGFETEDGVRAYNGDAYQSWVPRDTNQLGESQPELMISRGPMAEITVEPFLWPAFLAHGLVPTVTHPLYQHDLPLTHDPSEFDPRGTVTHNGRLCQILRGSPVNSPLAAADEYFVDTARGSLVSRYVRYSREKPVLRLDVNYHQVGEEWVAQDWVLTVSPNGQVSRIHRLTVEKFEPDPAAPESVFTIPAKPGMIVMTMNYPAKGSGLNPAYPANTTYVVQPDGTWRDVNAVGFTTLAGEKLPPERTGPSWWWWAVGAVAVTAVISLAVVRAARRKARRA